jgi:hypothetical protein
VGAARVTKRGARAGDPRPESLIGGLVPRRHETLWETGHEFEDFT